MTRKSRSTARRAACIACAIACLAGLDGRAGELAHATGMDALRERMRRLEALVFERTMTPLTIDRERARRADEIARLASDLAAAAGELARARGESFPDPARRDRFLANAHRLGEEAAELARVAEGRQLSEISTQIERIGYACASCHADFRAGVGPTSP